MKVINCMIDLLLRCVLHAFSELVETTETRNAHMAVLDVSQSIIKHIFITYNLYFQINSKKM